MKLDNTENVFKLRKRDLSQGSTLGPILLIIFVIDLSLFEKKCKSYKFCWQNIVPLVEKEINNLLEFLESQFQEVIKKLAKLRAGCSRVFMCSRLYSTQATSLIVHRICDLVVKQKKSVNSFKYTLTFKYRTSCIKFIWYMIYKRFKTC